MAQWPNGTGLGIRSRAAHRHGLQCGSPRLAAEESLVPWKTCGKHGENFGKLEKVGRQCGKNIWEKLGKLQGRSEKPMGKFVGNYGNIYGNDLWDYIWEKTGENSKNIRDNLGKLRENVGQK